MNGGPCQANLFSAPNVDTCILNGLTMARRKESFKTNTELQNDILHDRLVNAMTIKEIASKYPQFKEITYKRFFCMVLGKDESIEIERRARKRKKKVYSEIQKRRFS